MITRIIRWLFPEPHQTVLLPSYPIDERDCPKCGHRVGIWRTYADGHIVCVKCAE